VADTPQRLIDALSEREGRPDAAARLARASGVEALLIFVRDPDSQAIIPAPGFPRTLPGGPSWKAFLDACVDGGEFALEVEYPSRGITKTAHAHVSGDGCVVALIGGKPQLRPAALALSLRPILRLLQAEGEVISARGAAAAAALAMQRTSGLADTLDEARRKLAEQTTQLHEALKRADHLNHELTQLTQGLERRVEETLAERTLLANIVENTDALVLVVGTDYRLLAVNRAASNTFKRAYGCAPQVGANLLAFLREGPQEQNDVRGMWERALSGEEFVVAVPLGDPSLERRDYELKFNVLRDKDGCQIGAYLFGYDISERLEAESRLAEAQEALRQSQKMEAVGQLTGGIAHDFNNLLTVIMGGLEQIGRGLSPLAGEPAASRLLRSQRMALQASERAATLTSRLLAFARRQPLNPKPIDANQLITGLSDMLARTLGEQIELKLVTHDRLWMIQADANELESALLNVAVNARDAMPHGGRLVLATANVLLEQDHLPSIAEPVAPGEYVCISVTDTGVGMDPETLGHVFEPFFTTKPVGQGTGLGLSQVYGFVRQSAGHVRIDSQLGQGTTVEVYLPRLESPAQARDERPVSVKDLRGDETILVVEDHEDLRTYSLGVLREYGYHVLEAMDGPAALELLSGSTHIDLLLTDVMLPGGLDGRRVADEARRARPGLKVLFTSGYSRDAIISNGRLEPGVELLSKPFTSQALAERVRSILG
jgi:signal transduction histidine kinase